jgi:hypothetical protein
MMQTLSNMNFGEVMGFVALTGGLLIGLVAVAGGLWLENRKVEIAAGLKHDMLERGMSAEEIRLVLDAPKRRSDVSACDSRVSSCV